MMAGEDDKLCFVYVESPCRAAEALAGELRTLLGALADRGGPRDVVLPWAEIRVDRNEWWDPSKAADPVCGYQFRPFRLEIGDRGPGDDVPVHDYRASLIDLLHRLQRAGYAPTSSCAFEDQLPY
jgi:hypothetical protein